MKSIMQAHKQCFLCGNTQNLDQHHILEGIRTEKTLKGMGLKCGFAAVLQRINATAECIKAVKRWTFCTGRGRNGLKKFTAVGMTL